MKKVLSKENSASGSQHSQPFFSPAPQTRFANVQTGMASLQHSAQSTPFVQRQGKPGQKSAINCESDSDLITMGLDPKKATEENLKNRWRWDKWRKDRSFPIYVEPERIEFAYGVARFQCRNGLFDANGHIDGVLGPETWKFMKRQMDEKIYYREHTRETTYLLPVHYGFKYDEFRQELKQRIGRYVTYRSDGGKFVEGMLNRREGEIRDRYERLRKGYSDLKEGDQILIYTTFYQWKDDESGSWITTDIIASRMTPCRPPYCRVSWGDAKI